MKDRRQSAVAGPLAPELLAQASSQLEREIGLIENWLAELEGTSRDNLEAESARRSYSDMLQSRKDLLQALTKTT